MYAGKDFDQAEPGEQDAYTFDFSARLAAGETLTGATWSISPSGATIVATSYTAGGLTTAVIATTSAGLYLVDATATTASRTLKLNAHIPTVTPS